MSFSVLHDRGRRIEAERLAVEQCAGESRRMVALDPAGDVDEEREARGMGFGEPILSEALDLLVDLLGVFARIAAFEHALHELVAERLDAAAPLPRSHRAAQLVGLSR